MVAIYPALPICNGLAIILALLPISWHWQAKNTGTLLYIGWSVLANLNLMINTIIWRGTWEDLAPTWCTISAKIIIGQSVGLVAASLCINRKLYKIATIQSVSITAKSKRRNMIADLFLGIVCPIIAMGLHYIVQPTKYNIIENIGCWPTTQSTLLSVPMVYAWPILISCVSFIYCALSIRGFLKARRQFNQVLSNSGSGINMSRYFRLMALAGEEMLFSIPFSVFLLRQNLSYSRQWPWISWADTHVEFGVKIYPYPWILITANPDSFKAVMVSLWVVPLGGFCFFIWFGLGGEAFAAYKAIFYKIVAPLGIKPKPRAPPTSRWQNQLVSNTSSMPTQDRGRVPSHPDLDLSDEKESAYDLESGKTHAV
ncbi:hypothetical protein OPQ81_000742 [Rhizoctonia solani]|nr:hypothetical protein OPQ81_000742 [Rhizoctonia solani]